MGATRLGEDPGWGGTARSDCTQQVSVPPPGGCPCPLYFPYLLGLRMPAQGVPARSLRDHQRALGHHSEGRSRHQHREELRCRGHGEGGGRDPNGRQLLAPRTPTSPPLCSLPGSAPGERRPPCGGSRNPGHRGPACPRGRAAWYPETWQPPADSPAAHHLYLGRAWQVEKEPGFSVDPGAGPAGYTLSRNCMRGGPPAPPGKSPIMGLRTGPLRGARPMGHGSMESGQDPFSPSEPPAWERGLCLSQTSLSY